jgi:hypothetical protein
MTKRGQSSTEAVIIFSLLLTIFLLILISANTITTSFNEAQNQRLVRTALDDIIQNAQSVYIQGDGASQQIRITLPSSINETLIANYEVVVNISHPLRGIITFKRSSTFSLNGTLPTTEGLQVLTLTSNGTTVTIQ